MSTDTEDLTDRIAELTDTHDDDAGNGNGDPDPNSLEGRLRLQLPGHTYWQTRKLIPGPLAQLLERIGADVEDIVGDAPQACTAMWSTPTRVWSVAFHPGEADGRYDVGVKTFGGDDPVNVVRRDATADVVFDLLRTVGALD